jgi:hypothetical protein
MDQSLLRQTVVFSVGGIEFPISFCPIRLDIMWRDLAERQRKAAEFTADYIRIGRDIEARKKTAAEGRTEADALTAEMTAQGMDDFASRLLEAVKVCLEANDLAFDRDWWETHVQIEEVIVFLSAVTAKDLKKKREMAKLLALRPR